MADTLARMYVTLAPAILAGVLNMVWCTLPVAARLKKPIDGGRCLPDGERIFGDNKTWKGIAGMLLFGAVCSLLWGLVCGAFPPLGARNYLYAYRVNTPVYNLLMGLYIGFMYALFELPNSFLKRRLHIEPGKPLRGIRGIPFVFLDQADSLFGIVLCVATVYPMGPGFYLLYVLVGAATHILLNMLLYALKLRKNPF